MASASAAHPIDAIWLVKASKAREMSLTSGSFPAGWMLARRSRQAGSPDVRGCRRTRRRGARRRGRGSGTFGETARSRPVHGAVWWNAVARTSVKKPRLRGVALRADGAARDIRCDPNPHGLVRAAHSGYQKPVAHGVRCLRRSDRSSLLTPLSRGSSWQGSRRSIVWPTPFRSEARRRRKWSA